MSAPLDGLTWYIDPVAACLLGILMLGVIVLISSDFVRVTVKAGPPAADGSRWQRKVSHALDRLDEGERRWIAMAEMSARASRDVARPCTPGSVAHMLARQEGANDADHAPHL